MEKKKNFINILFRNVFHVLRDAELTNVPTEISALESPWRELSFDGRFHKQSLPHNEMKFRCFDQFDHRGAASLFCISHTFNPPPPPFLWASPSSNGLMISRNQPISPSGTRDSLCSRGLDYDQQHSCTPARGTQPNKSLVLPTYSRFCRSTTEIRQGQVEQGIFNCGVF